MSKLCDAIFRYNLINKSKEQLADWEIIKAAALQAAPQQGQPEKCLACEYWQQPSSGFCMRGSGDKFCVKAEQPAKPEPKTIGGNSKICDVCHKVACVCKQDTNTIKGKGVEFHGKGKGNN